MKPVRIRRIGLIAFAILAVLVIAALTSGGLAPQNQLSNQTNHKLSLSRPPFLQAARAQTPEEIADRLDDEAGIAAWIDTGFPIDLDDAVNAFLVIEDRTDDYIIGSVDLPNYPEQYDAHAYVHVNGWILAYYFRQDPASKIIRIIEEDITSTNLASIISIVAGASGVPTSIINYYDFRYPNAQNILLVYERYSDGDTFTINIPSSNAYYERSFATHHTYNTNNDIWLDGVQLSCIFEDGVCYGSVSAAQLIPEVPHTITVEYKGVLVITYMEP